MFKSYKYKILALVLALSLLATCVFLLLRDNYEFSEKSFRQSYVLGNCGLVAAMATLPSNKELYDQVVPSGQNFRRGSRQRKFEFNIYKLGKLHRVAVDVGSLPRNKENELVYSGSNNDDMVGPLLEKALVDLHFDGDYKSTYAIRPSFVLSSFTNSYYEDFPSVSIDLTFDISEVIDHGLKTNSPMVVGFKEDTPDGFLLKNHYYTLVNVTNNVINLYNPHG